MKELKLFHLWFYYGFNGNFQLLNELKKTDFLKYCLNNLFCSAVAELLYRMVNLPSEFELQNVVKQVIVFFLVLHFYHQ